MAAEASLYDQFLHRVQRGRIDVDRLMEAYPGVDWWNVRNPHNPDELLGHALVDHPRSANTTPASIYRGHEREIIQRTPRHYYYWKLLHMLTIPDDLLPLLYQRIEQLFMDFQRGGRVHAYVYIEMLMHRIGMLGSNENLYYRWSYLQLPERLRVVSESDVNVRYLATYLNNQLFKESNLKLYNNPIDQHLIDLIVSKSSTPYEYIPDFTARRLLRRGLRLPQLEDTVQNRAKYPFVTAWQYGRFNPENEYATRRAIVDLDVLPRDVALLTGDMAYGAPPPVQKRQLEEIRQRRIHNGPIDDDLNPVSSRTMMNNPRRIRAVLARGGLRGWERERLKRRLERIEKDSERRSRSTNKRRRK